MFTLVTRWCVLLLNRGCPFLPAMPSNQTSQLQDRLNNQEHTIAFLLEQAFRIKEDISACLQGSQGFRKEESLARKLLESHIQTITSIVKKLNQNIEVHLFPCFAITTQRILTVKSFFNQKYAAVVAKLCTARYGKK